MRVTLRTNLDLQSSSNGTIIELDTIELDTEKATLRDVLAKVADRYQIGTPIFDPGTNEIDRTEFSVLLNGMHYESLPARLVTRLSEGDQIQVYRWLGLVGGG